MTKDAKLWVVHRNSANVCFGSCVFAVKKLMSEYQTNILYFIFRIDICNNTT